MFMGKTFKAKKIIKHTPISSVPDREGYIAKPEENKMNTPILTSSEESIAPWNDKELNPEEVEVTVSITLSKTFKIKVDDYKEEIETDEEGNPTVNYDFTDCDLKSAVKEQIYLPNEIGEILRDRDKYPHLYAKVFKKLTKDALDWNVDDFEVILDD